MWGIWQRLVSLVFEQSAQRSSQPGYAVPHRFIGTSILRTHEEATVEKGNKFYWMCVPFIAPKTSYKKIKIFITLFHCVFSGVFSQFMPMTLWIRGNGLYWTTKVRDSGFRVTCRYFRRRSKVELSAELCLRFIVKKEQSSLRSLRYGCIVLECAVGCLLITSFWLQLRWLCSQTLYMGTV